MPHSIYDGLTLKWRFEMAMAILTEWVGGWRWWERGWDLDEIANWLLYLSSHLCILFEKFLSSNRFCCGDLKMLAVTEHFCSTISFTESTAATDCVIVNMLLNPNMYGTKNMSSFSQLNSITTKLKLAVVNHLRGSTCAEWRSAQVLYAGHSNQFGTRSKCFC